MPITIKSSKAAEFANSLYFIEKNRLSDIHMDRVAKKALHAVFLGTEE
jgi:hypothetical protein